MKTLIQSNLHRIGIPMLAVAASMAADPSLAQSAQGQPVMLTVGYAPGGGADVSARQLSAPLQKVMGQTVVVENRAGAGGSIAALYYMQQPKDRNHMLVLTGNDAIMNPVVLAAAKYDPKELRLLHPLIFSDVVLVSARADAPDSMDKLIELIRKSGGTEYSFGNWGIGSTPHLAAEDFRDQAGVKTIDVQYRGIAPIVQDLVGGQIDYAFIPLISSVLDMIRSGKLKAVSMATPTRNPSLSDVPGTEESKILKNFDYRVWPGVFVHRSTPEPVVEELQKSVASVVNGEAYQKWSVDTGNRPMTPMNLAQAEAFYLNEMTRSQKLAAKMKLAQQ